MVLSCGYSRELLNTKMSEKENKAGDKKFT